MADEEFFISFVSPCVFPRKETRQEGEKGREEKSNGYSKRDLLSSHRNYYNHLYYCVSSSSTYIRLRRWFGLHVIFPILPTKPLIIAYLTRCLIYQRRVLTPQKTFEKERENLLLLRDLLFARPSKKYPPRSPFHLNIREKMH